MANAGLPQGFVRFGTRHEAILKALHRGGVMTYADLMEETGIDCPRRAYAAIMQLLRSKLIYRHDKVGGHGSTERAAYTYALTPKKIGDRYRKDSGAERSARYRARLKQRSATTVFAWRPA